MLLTPFTFLLLESFVFSTYNIDNNFWSVKTIMILYYATLIIIYK